MRFLWLILTTALVSLPALAAWESVGPDGGYIMAMAIDPREPARVCAVPYDYPDSARLLASTDAGGSWNELGRLPDTYVMVLAIDPGDHERLYAIGRGNLLHRSTDGGRNWASSSLPGYGMALAVDPLAGGRLYVSGYYYHGGAYRAAAYVSNDHGASWTVSMPQPDTTGYGYAVAADPVDAGAVYLGAGSSQLYKSTDAGESWRRASDGLPAGSSVQSLSVNPVDNRVLLAATSSGFYRTADGGGRWTLTGSFDRTQSVAFSPVGGAVAYGLVWTDAMRVCVSTDGGVSWVVPSPGYVVLKSAVLHADPGAAATVWVNTQTGIYRSTDAGSNWHPAHAGLRITRISCVSPSPVDGRRLYLEVHENGIFRTESAGDSWTRCSDFLACGNICGIGVAPGGGQDVLYALEGAG
ncbi:MAG: hypothetical protein R6X14_03715 [bacterium]